MGAAATGAVVPVSDILAGKAGGHGTAVGVPRGVSSLTQSKSGRWGVWFDLCDRSSYPQGVRVGYWTADRRDAENCRSTVLSSEVVLVSGDFGVQESGGAVVWATIVRQSDVPLADVLPPPGIPVEEAWGEVWSSAEALPEPLRSVTTQTLCRYRDRFCKWAASSSYHEAFPGGLLEHTCRLLRMSREVSAAYGSIPEDSRHVLTAALILHDIGKVFTYGPPPWNQRLPEESLFGHTLLACLMVVDACCALGISWWEEPMVRALLHAIAAHHGRFEWGAVVEPKTPEAWALHTLDNVEAKLSHCSESLSRGVLASDMALLTVAAADSQQTAANSR
jgi:hypothetical protein